MATLDQIKDSLKFIINKLEHELYVGVLPANYCALTCFNCQIILNEAANCLLNQIHDMIKEEP